MASTIYNNNQNLKSVSVPIQWSTEKLKELNKCKNDYMHFIETYCKIVHVDKGLVPFELWPFQKYMINTIVKVRCKSTGLVEEITIGELYARSKENENLPALQNTSTGNEI
jgi:hypothetical protein